MRNLIEHPPTKQEVVKCLSDLRIALTSTESVGDMRPLLLQIAAEVISVIPDRDFGGWMETGHLLSSPANADHLRRSIAEADKS
jgi:hypothetical protein